MTTIIYCDRCGKEDQIHKVTDGYLDYDICEECKQAFYLLRQRQEEELDNFFKEVKDG